MKRHITTLFHIHTLFTIKTILVIIKHTTIKLTQSIKILLLPLQSNFLWYVANIKSFPKRYDNSIAEPFSKIPE